MRVRGKVLQTVFNRGSLGSLDAFHLLQRKLDFFLSNRKLASSFRKRGILLVRFRMHAVNQRDSTMALGLAAVAIMNGVKACLLAFVSHVKLVKLALKSHWSFFARFRWLVMMPVAMQSIEYF